MLRKIFLLATVLALAALLARGHSTFSTSLAADAPQQSATEKDNSAQLERALKTEAEHHKLESLVYEHDSLASHWPTWAEHYRPPRLFDKAAAELQAVRKRLATEINYKILEDRDWIAYYLLRAKMVEEAESIQQCRERTESVSTVAPTAQLIYELRSKLYDPEDKERVAKADEIASIPEKIEAAKAKIKDSKPRDLDLCMGWLERDARALEEWGKLHSATVPEFGKTYGASITKAIDAMKAYREWLDKNRDKWPKGEDKRLGEEKFAETLRKSELECRSPKELDEMARAQMKSLKAEMEELAKKIDKDKTAWQLLDEMKAQHPEAGLIAPTYARLLERARDFVVKKDIVSVPKDWLNNVRVERFIDKDRFMPYAFYNADGESSHYFMSSEPTEGMKPQERDDKLQGHNYYSMFTVTVHETFPGHHLQFAHAAGDHHVPHVDSYSAFFSEGWGLYCEQLMYEQGFYEKAEQPKGWDFDPKYVVRRRGETHGQ